jgi:hypothetical protein
MRFRLLNVDLQVIQTVKIWDLSNELILVARNLAASQIVSDHRAPSHEVFFDGADDSNPRTPPVLKSGNSAQREVHGFE